jgi:hypothetical protein
MGRGGPPHQDEHFTKLFAHPPASSGHRPVTLKEVNVRAAEVLRFAVETSCGGEPEPAPTTTTGKTRGKKKSSGTGEILPRPVFHYRRLRVQGGQGRGGIGYRFTV